MTLNAKQIMEARRAEQRAAFHGKTYRYYTQSSGTRTIGVFKGLGNDYIVGYFNDCGSRKRVKSAVLPPHADPDKLQGWLDSWAASKRLLEATA